MTIFSEDFDALTVNNSLAGQGDWTALAGGNDKIYVEVDPGVFGLSGNVAETIGSDTQRPHTGITTMNDTDITTASFDVHIDANSPYFSWNIGSSVRFGVLYGNAILQEASAGNQSVAHSLVANTSYHMTLSIDPTANSNAGSATFTYAPYTAENTLGTTQTFFSNIEMRLDEGGRALSDVSSGILRMHSGSKSYVDNMSITQTAVPEPSAFALVALGMLGLFVYRRRVKR